MYRYTHRDGRTADSDLSVFNAMVKALGLAKTHQVLDTESLEQSDYIFQNPDKNFEIPVPFKSSYLKVNNEIVGTIEVFRENDVVESH